MKVEAAERIWVELVTARAYINKIDDTDVEYVRADKVEELAADNGQLEICLEEANAALAEKDKKIAALREWQPIETAPFNRPVDLWCTYPDAPATWGNGLPAGEIVHGRHKTEEYGWFGNQSNDGVPRGDGPDIIPVAWREPAPRIPIEMMEAFLDARTAGGNNGE